MGMKESEFSLRGMIREIILESASKEKIAGGLAANKTVADIAKKHGVEVSDIKRQLQKGIKVEMEHTDDKALAREIAMDHLMEDPLYYDKLEKVEQGDE